MSPPLPVVVLVSGNGTNLQAIIDAANDGLPIDIRAVISNRADAAGLKRAARAGIPGIVIEHHDFPDRASFDSALIAAIDDYTPQLVCLAGFMRILTAGFINHYHGRLINIHPALLPQFPGLHTHQQALDAGVSEHGASVHFVTEEVDGGPVIARTRVPVLPGDDAATLAARVLEREHELYPRVIGWIATGRLQLVDGRVLLDGQPADAGNEPLTG